MPLFISNVTLPNEIADFILSFIDKPVDLLALALSCKALRDLVIPVHLGSRWIRCGLTDTRTWRILASVPRIVAQTRYFEVLPEWLLQDSFQGGNVDLGDKGDFPDLRAVIRLMSSLIEFKWLSFIPPPLHFFDSLSSCQNLQDVEILNWNSCASGEGAKLEQSKLWSFSNLRRFSYTEKFVGQDPDIHRSYTKLLADMLLERCPTLEDLQLFFDYDKYDDEPPMESLQNMFRHGHWPNLRRLSLEACVFTEGTKTHFFSSHPNLHALSLSDSMGWDISLYGLPPLHSLEVDTFASTDNVPFEIRTSLRHLTFNLLGSWSLHPDDFQYFFLSEAQTLESLVLRCNDGYPDLDVLQCFPQKVPTIKRFALVLVWRVYDGHDTNGEKDFFIKILTSLPHLTHFSPVYIRNWAPLEEAEDATDASAQIDKALESILLLAPKLKFVGVKTIGAVEVRSLGTHEGESDHPRWVSIQRDEAGGYLGFTDVGYRDRKDTEVDLWGDIYWGAGREVLHQYSWLS